MGASERHDVQKLREWNDLGILDADRSRANLRALCEPVSGVEEPEQPRKTATGSVDELSERAAAKLGRGQPVSRAEAAAFLGVSTKTLQRMDARGTLPRCPGFGTVVRYAARDVLRLASANGKER